MARSRFRNANLARCVFTFFSLSFCVFVFISTSGKREQENEEIQRDEARHINNVGISERDEDTPEENRVASFSEFHVFFSTAFYDETAETPCIQIPAIIPRAFSRPVRCRAKEVEQIAFVDFIRWDRGSIIGEPVAALLSCDQVDLVETITICIERLCRELNVTYPTFMSLAPPNVVSSDNRKAEVHLPNGVSQLPQNVLPAFATSPSPSSGSSSFPSPSLQHIPTYSSGGYAKPDDLVVLVRAKTGQPDGGALLEWLELQRNLGVSQICVYDAGLHPETRRVLRFYRGVVQVVPWPLTRVLLRHFSQHSIERVSAVSAVLSSTDAFFRLRGRWHYAVPLDFNEILLPRRHESLLFLSLRLFFEHGDASHLDFERRKPSASTVGEQQMQRPDEDGCSHERDDSFSGAAIVHLKRVRTSYVGVIRRFGRDEARVNASEHATHHCTSRQQRLDQAQTMFDSLPEYVSERYRDRMEHRLNFLHSHFNI